MNKFYYRAIVILSLILLSNINGNAQVSNYGFSQATIPGSYNNLILSDTYQQGAALSFDFISPDISFPTGFTFPYNCRNYSSFRISNNGFLLLGLFGNPVITESNAIANTNNIPAEGVIQPFGIDLTNSIASGANSSITYGMDPTSSSGAFVIQFRDLARANANTDKVNVQVWLYPTGQIQFRYGNCLPSSTSTSTNSPTVGLKGGYTNDIMVRAVSATGSASTWANSARGTSIFSTSRYVGSAISPYGSIYPLNNLIYSFNPVGCYNPVVEAGPACTSLETEWFLTTSGNKMPSKSWTKWPLRGQNAWFSEYENAGVTKWTNPTQGAYTMSGANGTQHSARFHTYSLAQDYYGDLDWHLDLSSCASSAKELNFYYLNNTTGTDNLKVYLSTNGGSTFTLLNSFGAETAWSQKTINLGVLSSANTIVRFRATSDGVSELGSDIGIDEVCVSGTGAGPVITTTPTTVQLCKVGQGVSSANLTASGATNYNWSPVFGLNTTSGSSVTATPSSTTTYTVVGSDASCATSSKTVMVDVAPTIQLTTNATPPSLCYGSTTTLSGSDSAIGTQSLPNGYCNAGPLSPLDEDCGKVVFAGINNTSAQNGLIGSQGTGTGVPSIYTNFTSSVPAGEVLTGDSYPISISVIDDGGTSYQNATKVYIDYNRDGDFDDSGELVFTTNYVFGANTQTGSVLIPTNAKAGITAMRVCVYETTSNNITACGTPNSFGEVEDYAINIIKRPVITGPGSSYVWSPSTFLNTTNGSSVTASGVTSNITYTLTATDPNGCHAISLRPVFVSSTTPISTNPIVGNSNICIGTNTNLSVTAFGGTPPYSYVWAGQNITGSGSSVTVAPTSSSTYTVTATDGCGATSSRTKTITISGAPPVVASANPAGVCSGQATTLQASGASSYAWSGGVSSGVPFTPNATTTYTVTGSSNNGCTKTATVTVTVYAPPVLGASANPGVNVCNGTPVILNGAGASTYSWSNGVTNGVSFTPTTTNTYTVTGTSAQGCTNTMTLAVAVKVKPTVTATKSPNFTTCRNVPITLSGSGANTYTWSGGVVNGQSFAPNATNTYTVTGISTNGCTNTSTILAVIHQLPTVTTTVSPANASICLNENVTLSGSGASLYAWSGGVTNAQSFSPTSTATYTVTGTASTGCTNTSTRTVTVKNLPNVSTSASPSNSICLNESVSLSGSGASSYTWSGGVTNAQNFTPTSTSTYTVTGTGSNGCTNTSTQSVTVKSLPNVNASASPGNSICLNESVSVSGSGASSYSWSNGIINGQNFTPTSTGTYTVTGTGTNGCTNTSTESITVKTLPNVSTSASPSSSICLNESVSLSGNGASSYTWSGGLTNAQNFTPTSTSTYTVTGTGSNGCTNTSTRTVTVKSLPNVSTSASPSNSICLNEAVSVSGSGAATYAWSGGITNAQNFTPTSTATYTVTGTASNGCTNTSTQSVTVKSLPNVNASASPSNSICLNEAVSVSGSGASSYSWSNGIINAQNFTPTTTATYTVTGTGTNGCTNTSTQSITVKSLPNVNASASPSNSICLNEAVSVSGSGASSYSWSNAIINGQNFTPTTTATYTVTGTGSNGCTNTTTETITVKTLPNVTASANPSSTICLNEAVSVSGSGAASYSWSNGITNGQNFTPTITATYTVTGTSSNGCTKSTTTTVTVNSLPNVTVSANPSNSICLNDGVSLSGSGAASYTWSGGISNGQNFTPTSTTTYTVTGTSSDGCTKTTAATVTVKSLPVVTASASPSNSICLNEAVSVSGSGAATYAWSGGVTNAQNFTPTSSGTYTVTGTASNGCTNTSTQSITVKTLPNVTASASPSNSICLNESVNLSGSGATSYTWSGGITNGQNFTPTNSGSYTVTGTGSNGCSKTHTETITVKALPTITANASPGNSICAGESILLSGSGGQSYVWSGAVTNNSSFVPAASGSYTVTGTASNNCSSTDVVAVTVKAVPSVNLTIEPSAVVCKGTAVKFTAAGAASYNWTGGITNATPFAAQSTNTYTVTGSNAQNCTSTAIVNLLVNQPTKLALATSLNASSMSGTTAGSMNHFDGGDLTYTDANCNVIMNIDDGAGGNNLGMINAQVNVESLVPIYNGQPYVRRWYDVTPTNNGPALVTLYLTQDDFDDYNAANNNYPLLPTTTNNADPKIANIRVTKVDGAIGTGSPIVITPSVSWNATESYWELSFPVTSFSQFYVHSANANNSPLPVKLKDFYGIKKDNGNKLHWNTISEINNSHFNVLKSTDNNTFKKIGEVYSKAIDGNSRSALSYTYFDNNAAIGNNYYKLEQLDINGNKTYSKTINLIWTENLSRLLIYPNPASNFIHVDFETEEEGSVMYMRILDMSGRVVVMEKSKASLGNNHKQIDIGQLAKGVYTLQIMENGEFIHATKITKALR